MCAAYAHSLYQSSSVYSSVMFASAGDSAFLRISWRGALAPGASWRDSAQNPPRGPAPVPAPSGRALCGRDRLDEPHSNWCCPSNRGAAVVNRPRALRSGHTEVERLESLARGACCLSPSRMRPSPAPSGLTARGGGESGCWAGTAWLSPDRSLVSAGCGPLHASTSEVLREILQSHKFRAGLPPLTVVETGWAKLRDLPRLTKVFGASVRAGKEYPALLPQSSSHPSPSISFPPHPVPHPNLPHLPFPVPDPVRGRSGEVRAAWASEAMREPGEIYLWETIIIWIV